MIREYPKYPNPHCLLQGGKVIFFTHFLIYIFLCDFFFYIYKYFFLQRIPKAMAKTDIFEETLAMLIVMLSPLAPHFASELWVAFCSSANNKRHSFYDLVSFFFFLSLHNTLLYDCNI